MHPLLIGGLSLAALAVASLWGYWSKVRRRLLRVADGVYKSGAFSARRLPAIVRRYGLRSVIDLRRPCRAVDEERAALAPLGAEYHNLPSAKTPSREAVEEFLQLIRRLPRPVLIHCKHGAGRGPLFAALYLIEVEGWDAERALRTTYWPSPSAGARVDRHAGLFRPAAGQEGHRSELSRHHRVLSSLAALTIAMWLVVDIDYRLVVAGTLLMLAGLAWQVWCSGYVRPGPGRAPTGPFRLVRHPQYVGTPVFIAGAMLTVSLPWGWRVGLIAATAAACVFRIRREERKLVGRLGDWYADWTRTTRAAVPSPAGVVRLLRDARLADFTWSHVRPGGGRVLALVGTLTFAALWARMEWQERRDPRLASLSPDVAVGLLVLLAILATAFVWVRSRESRATASPG